MQRTPTGAASDWRAFRRLGRGFAAVGLVMAGIGLLPHAAGATAPTEDPRAEVVGGNVTTCAQVGYPSDTQLGAAADGAASNSDISVTNDGTYLQVSVTGSVTIDVIIVKGGNNYNVYPGTVHDDLRAPLTTGGTIPKISHWFLCYHEGSSDTTTTTQPTTTTTEQVTTTTEQVTTTTEQVTTTTEQPTTTTEQVTTTTEQPTTTTTTEQPTTTTEQPTTTTAQATTTTAKPTTTLPTEVLPSTTVRTTTTLGTVLGDAVSSPGPQASVLGEQIVRSQALPRTGVNTMALVLLGGTLMVLGCLVSHRASVLRRR